MQQPEKSPRKRIAVFLCFSGAKINFSPAVQSLFTLLARDDFNIDLFTETPVSNEQSLSKRVRSISGASTRGTLPDQKVMYNVNSPMKRVTVFQPLDNIGNQLKLLLWKIKEWGQAGIKTFWSYFNSPSLVISSSFRNAIRRHLAGQQYDCVIGVEEEGLILAHHYLPNVPLVYYSLELYYEGHPFFFQGDPKRKQLKNLARKAFNSIKFVIIQDHDRAEVLFWDMHQPYDPWKVLPFPVSYIGKAHLRRSNLLRQKFPEMGERKILLQSGQIIWARRSPELIRSTRRCPPDLAVVFHGRKIDSESMEALKESGTCWINQDLVPFETLADVPASAISG
ncbi:MAG: hypothetical protein HC884_12055 [Chloroflexaceae bacterium]|nr:hypothetical protein [Chloroflexaceae bacterium]